MARTTGVKPMSAWLNHQTAASGAHRQQCHLPEQAALDQIRIRTLRKLLKSDVLIIDAAYLRDQTVSTKARSLPPAKKKRIVVSDEDDL